MSEGLIATCFGSRKHVHHETTKILNESYYVKHLILFYAARSGLILKQIWESYVYWTVHHCDSWRIKDQLDVTCYFISLLMCSTCVAGFSLQYGYHSTQPHRTSNTHRTKNYTTSVVIQQNSRKLLMMDILMSETCWAHKKWNKIASDIKLVFYSSDIRTLKGSCVMTIFTKKTWTMYDMMKYFPLVPF